MSGLAVLGLGFGATGFFALAGCFDADLLLFDTAFGFVVDFGFGAGLRFTIGY